MSAVMITGISGAGKSTVAGALAHRGLASIDADNDPSLARFMDRTGAVVAFPAAPDFAWLSRHSWEWKPGSTGRPPGSRQVMWPGWSWVRCQSGACFAR